MKALTVTLALMIGCCISAPASEPINVTPVAASTWLAATPSARILDVRTREEFSTGHLAKALLIPWTDKDFVARAAKELDPVKPVLVYCRSGRRSTEAANALAKLGFTNVRNLEGGILAWENAGQPIIKSK